MNGAEGQSPDTRRPAAIRAAALTAWPRAMQASLVGPLSLGVRARVRLGKMRGSPGWGAAVAGRIIIAASDNK